MIERIIGIDFGTSTSLVKIKNYKDGQPMDGDPTSSQYVEFDGRDMVPTLIRFAEMAEYYGYEAKQNYPGSTLYKNFKLNLQSPDAKAKAEAQELTKKYFHFLHKQYAEQSGHFGQCDTERTLVSYPAKWTRETRDFMVRTAKDMGFKNVTGMDEPTAALYTVMVQESDRLVKQGYLTAGKPAYVLMIDMGAGTTDLALCKYTPGGQNRIIDTWPPAESGVLFGGREMDELLLKYVLDYLGKCGISEKMRANVEKQKLEDCKSWKEDSVSAALRNRQKVPYCTFIQDLMMMVDEDTPFPAIDRGVLESYCKNYISRYAELIAGAMFHAQKADPGFHGGADLSLAVLTGGHSQWYFARDLLCGTLPGYEGGVGIRLAEDQVVSLTRPQGTVSSGMVFSVQDIAPAARPTPQPEQKQHTYSQPTPPPTPQSEPKQPQQENPHLREEFRPAQEFQSVQQVNRNHADAHSKKTSLFPIDPRPELSSKEELRIRMITFTGLQLTDEKLNSVWGQPDCERMLLEEVYGELLCESDESFRIRCNNAFSVCTAASAILANTFTDSLFKSYRIQDKQQDTLRKYAPLRTEEATLFYTEYSYMAEDYITNQRIISIRKNKLKKEVISYEYQNILCIRIFKMLLKRPFYKVYSGPENVYGIYQGGEVVPGLAFNNAKQFQLICAACMRWRVQHGMDPYAVLNDSIQISSLDE